MEKRYIRINFQNSPSTATPLDEVTLNKIDNGIDDCDNAIEDIYNVKAAKSDIVNVQTNNAAKICGAALAYSMGQSIQELNDNLTTVGNWTPVLGLGGVSFIHSVQSGKFIKIGRLVHIVCRVKGTKPAGSGAVAVGGLPHAALTYSSCTAAYCTGLTSGNKDLSFEISGSGINIYLGNANPAALTGADISGEFDIYDLTATYISAT